MDDDDDWQEMPVIASGSAPAHRRRAGARSSDDDDDDERDSNDEQNSPSSSRYEAYHAGPSSSRVPMTGAPRAFSPTRRGTGHQSTSQGAYLPNATGKSLKLNDARGYDWRAKPTGAPGMHSSRRADENDSRSGPQRIDQDDDDNNNNEDDSEEESDDEKGKGYTQLRLDEDVEGDQLHDATSYLFGDSALSAAKDESSIGYSHQSESTATPLSQMMTTKSLLSEPQKIAYVGLCALKAKEMVRAMTRVPGAAKDLKESIRSIEEWEVKVMARLFQHMDIDASEQAMIKSLGDHGVLASDLAPSLVTTQQIENPDYDPIAAQEKEEKEAHDKEQAELHREEQEADDQEHTEPQPQPADEVAESDSSVDGSTQSVPGSPRDNDSGSPTLGEGSTGTQSPAEMFTPRAETDQELPDVNQPSVTKDVNDTEPLAAAPLRADPNTAAQAEALDANVAATPAQPSTFGLTAEPQSVQPLPSALPGVTTELSTSDTHITLDLRWTILCDLFLVMTADSVYDARSRVLLERVAEQVGLSWMDVTKFEKRVTDALEIEEGVEKLKDKSAIARREAEASKKKWAMIGLATVGGGLVIGLSAGLAAPLVGAGLAGFLGTVGIGGTTSFLGGVGGAALITTTGAVGGAAVGGRGMTRRTQSVKTFAFKPIHNNKRVNCIVTVPGFMNGDQDDVRLPFSVIDSIMGDVFSVLWEPEMMKEMGNAIYILWNETLVMGVQQVLAATIAGGLLGALAWPLWLSKLGYLIDNPWSNATTRAEAAGKILADILAHRQLGVRPITLVGFSLGARAIFYALHELHKKKAYGVVQNVYIFGAPVTASDKTWKEVRSVVSGRFVNGFSRTDWILGYLFRATSGGLRSIAGLHPVERVPDIENVDVTTSVPGHLQYRAFMPLVMSEVGFKVTQDWFDEPEDLSKIPDRQMVLDDLAEQEEEMKSVNTKTGGFGRIFRRNKGTSDGSAPGTPTADASRPGTPAKAPTTVAGGIVVPKREAGTGREEYDEGDADADDEDDMPPREEAASASAEAPLPPSEPAEAAATPAETTLTPPEAAATPAEDRPATPEVELPANRSAHVDTDAILAELRESGIEVRELQSSLPALSLASAPSSPAVKDSSFTTNSADMATNNEQAASVAPLATPVIREPPPRPSLRSSMSSIFGSRKASSKAQTSSQASSRVATPTLGSRAAPSPAPAAVEMEKPSLSLPGGVYAQGSAAAAAASSSARHEQLHRQDSNPGWGDSPSEASAAEASNSVHGADRGWAKPFNSSAAFERDLPLQPPGYAPPSDVNLSFASDFDDGDEAPGSEQTTADSTLGARSYGLSAEAARELARQFGAGTSVGNGGGTSGSATKETYPSSDFDAGGWGAPQSFAGTSTGASPYATGAGKSSNAASLSSAAFGGGWGASPGDEQVPSTADMSREGSLPRPLDSLYVGSGRAKEEDVDTAAAKVRTPMTFQEASENPWG
ncbi:DUF726-domain-containing protein [Microstroma glucosiphilum]|uniref:DUF726-domain-containing protein n=1 Tax=Pseudomicrostroma glucosiphilum TaxID=1684307 RepID=A0A316TZS1_9BASI|nr:DUF726-domain-containing protein [Pseudomicrostroma glucosiphilum]PWN17753.1 DUF726-domain-containing protein [Pseudomicrostroma glucosiphilum]